MFKIDFFMLVGGILIKSYVALSYQMFKKQNVTNFCG